MNMPRRRHHTTKRARRSTKRARHHHRGMRRVLRNVFGADVMKDVVVPVLGGTAGFVLARYAGNMASERIAALADPRYGKLAAAAVGIPLTFAAAGMSPMVRQNAGAIVLGMGLAATEPFLRGMALLGGGTPAMAEPPAEPPAASSGVGSYYTEGMLGLGRGYDVSHAGAPYQGMLGVGEYVDQPFNGVGEYVDQPFNGVGEYVDQPFSGLSGLGEEPGSQVAADHAMNRMEAVTTITPTDLAARAVSRPAVAPVTTPFPAADKGYAGGMFARHLFSGMMGS